MKKINENIKSGNFELSKGHQPFMKVPKGGSSCSNCKFLSEDKKNCVNKHFIEWYGKSELPQPIDEYCSDFYEPSEEYLAKGGELKFYSDCVGYPVLSDLEHIIDNEKEITYKTFVANVNKEDRLMLERRLGYGKDFPITKDWHVRFFRSKDEDNNTVYFMRHSAIEYVFSPKSSGMFCQTDDDYESGGKLKCDFDKETKSCNNACNMENGGQIKSFKSPNDLVALRYFDGNEELGHLVYYASNESISIGLNEDPYNFKNEMYIEFLEVKEEHRGKGIAKKLLNRAIQDAKELGIEVITLRRDSGLGCNYGSDYDNYLKKIYSSVGFVQTWTQKEFEESNGEKNICAMHLVVSESKFNSGGQLPSIIKYARIKPIREGGEERVVRVSPDSVGGFVAGYVIYYPAKSNNKVAYFNKSDFQNLLDDGSYTLFNTIEQAQSSKPMEIDIEEQLKIRQRMRSLLKLLKYKTTDETGMTKEDRFIDRVVQLIYDGKDFKSKLDIERIAENEFEFEDKRKVRELTEYAVLSVGREISKVYGNDVTVAYKKMVSLYSNQPYSTHRTGTSVNLGQFSTPLPMSYLMGCYVGINIPSDKVYFEPTGGNGSLTVAGNVEDFVINELDMHRYNNLLKENYKLVLNQDATKKFDFDFKFDGMLANPPFATTKTDIIVGGFHISGLEQQIIVNSLMYLKDKAKIAFIIGGHTEFDEEGRIKSKKDRAFLSYLFKHYYMDDVININGSLYGRQGTTYPIRIILLAAKKSEPSGFYPLRNEALGKFEPFSVKVIDTFDELFKRTEKYIQKSL